MELIQTSYTLRSHDYFARLYVADMERASPVGFRTGYTANARMPNGTAVLKFTRERYPRLQPRHISILPKYNHYGFHFTEEAPCHVVHDFEGSMKEVRRLGEADVETWPPP